MLLKLIFLVAYFLLVFTLARVFDICWNIISSFPSDGGIFSVSQFPLCLIKNSGCKPSNIQKESSVIVEDSDTLLSGQKSNNNVFEETNFASYEEYLESVEDTKSSVWVVKLIPIRKTRHIIPDKEWRKLKVDLLKYKIKTATFSCGSDPRLCIQLKAFHPSFVLSMPRGFYPKGNVSFFLYDESKGRNYVSSNNVFDWVKRKMYLRVKKVHSLSEVFSPVAARKKSEDFTEPSMFFIYKTNKNLPPMFLTALSVKFSGRVKFYLFHEDDLVSHETIALSKYESYNYGTKRGESFSYNCIELFLQTLHPEVNDIFVVSIVLINMACWLELFLQKGGPLRRLFYYIWGFTITNMLLVFLWLPIIQIICLPQVQPVIHLILKTLQKIMLTNLAAVVRQDILQVSQHIHILFIGFLFYGILLGYIRLKMRNDSRDNSSFAVILSEDIEEFHETISSFIQFMTPSLQIYHFEERIESILRRLMYPDLWLHTYDSQNYVLNLPKWQKCECALNIDSDIDVSSSDTDYSDVESKACLSNQKIPSYVIPSDDCAICLELYKCKDMIMGITCGHSFHEKCLLTWLVSVNSQRRCPVCRWPADILKGGDVELIDVQDLS